MVETENPTPEKKYTKLVIITDQEIRKFKKKLDDFMAEQTSTCYLTTGVNTLPIQQGNSMGLMQIPYAYIDVEVTEEEYNEWINQKFIMT